VYKPSLMGELTEIEPDEGYILHYYIIYYDYIYLHNFGSCCSLVAFNLFDYTLDYRDLCDDYRMLWQATETCVMSTECYGKLLNKY
jgi:hypothetical protein